MPTQSKILKVTSKIDTNLVQSVEQYLINYLTDIPLRGLAGEKLSDKAIEQKIRIATEQLEGMLSLRIPRQRILEMQDFERTYFESWGYIRLNHPVYEVNELGGHLNYAHQILYPKGWSSWRRQLLYGRNIHIVPGQQENLTSATSDFVAVFTGRFPIFGYSSASYIPNYWNIDYTTGWSVVPDDLQDAILKLATMQLLAILGDISFGAGIASSSISIDGLSQSLGTTQSAENSLYSARVGQFVKELKYELRWLKGKYIGIVMDTV
jgi:hypothetical protein